MGFGKKGSLTELLIMQHYNTENSYYIWIKIIRIASQIFNESYILFMKRPHNPPITRIQNSV